MGGQHARPRKAHKTGSVGLKRNSEKGFSQDFGKNFLVCGGRDSEELNQKMTVRSGVCTLQRKLSAIWWPHLLPWAQTDPDPGFSHELLGADLVFYSQCLAHSRYLTNIC